MKSYRIGDVPKTPVSKETLDLVNNVRYGMQESYTKDEVTSLLIKARDNAARECEASSHSVTYSVIGGAIGLVLGGLFFGGFLKPGQRIKKNLWDKKK